MITTGVIIVGDLPLPAILSPIAADLDRCFWLIDSYSGPFRSSWLYASPDNEAIYDEKFVETDAGRNASISCWRPGTLPRYAEHVVIDEWTYLFAMQCDESAVAQRVDRIGRWLGKFNEDFFAQMEEAELFLMHVDGWWELYTANTGWRAEVRAAFPQSFERPTTEAGTPPARP